MSRSSELALDSPETMSAAISRLARAGFGESFQARNGELVALATSLSHAPEELCVREIVRFEGDSDPGDAAVLFALCSRDGRTRGTFVAGYGTTSDAESAGVIARLDASYRSGKRASARNTATRP